MALERVFEYPRTLRRLRSAIHTILSRIQAHLLILEESGNRDQTLKPYVSEARSTAEGAEISPSRSIPIPPYQPTAPSSELFRIGSATTIEKRFRSGAQGQVQPSQPRFKFLRF